MRKLRILSPLAAVISWLLLISALLSLYESDLLCLADEVLVSAPSTTFRIDSKTKIKDIFKCSGIHFIGSFNEYYVACELNVPAQGKLTLLEVVDVKLDGSTLSPLPGVHAELTFPLNTSLATVSIRNSQLQASAVEIRAANVSMDEQSAVNVSAHGLKFGPGYNSWTSMGGSYGGIGGASLTQTRRKCEDVPPNDFFRVVGDVSADSANFRGYGSGGGNDESRGGGRIRLVAEENVEINGSLLANGGDACTDCYDSAGAGGSIIVVAKERIHGNATVQANGGEPSHFNGDEFTGGGGGGGGGGGRVVFDSKNAEELGPARVEAYGGGLSTDKNAAIGWCQLGGDGTILKMQHSTKDEGGLDGSEEMNVRLTIAGPCVGGIESSIVLDSGSELNVLDRERSVRLSASQLTLQGYVGPSSLQERDLFGLTLIGADVSFSNALTMVHELEVDARGALSLDKFSELKFRAHVNIQTEASTKIEGFLQPLGKPWRDGDGPDDIPLISVTSKKDVELRPQTVEMGQVELRIKANGTGFLDMPFDTPFLRLSISAANVSIPNVNSAGSIILCSGKNMTIEGTISSSWLGCGSGVGPGKSDVSGEASGGAGHGGRGGNVLPGSTGGGSAYDISKELLMQQSVTGSWVEQPSVDKGWPIWPGSGAASGDTPNKLSGGSGGGIIYIGSTKLNVTKSASISARGGAVEDDAGKLGGGGGGGIIRVTYADTTDKTIAGNGEEFIKDGGRISVDGGDSTGGENGGTGVMVGTNCHPGRGGFSACRVRKEVTVPGAFLSARHASRAPAQATLALKNVMHVLLAISIQISESKSNKPVHSEFNMRGNCSYACFKGRNGLDCLTPFERLVKPIGGPIGFVILVFAVTGLIFGAWGFFSYRSSKSELRRYAQYKAQRLRDELSLETLTRTLTARLTDQDLNAHVARLYLAGDNHLKNAWRLNPYFLPASLRDIVEEGTYANFASTCNNTLFMRRRQLHRVVKLSKYIGRYGGRFFRDMNYRVHGTQLKVGFSSDFSLGYFDVLISQQSSSSSLNLVAMHAVSHEDLVLVVGGSGSFFRPYHLDTNDIIVRAIPSRLELLEHNFWIDFVADINQMLRVLPQPSSAARRLLRAFTLENIDTSFALYPQEPFKLAFRVSRLNSPEVPPAKRNKSLDSGSDFPGLSSEENDTVKAETDPRSIDFRYSQIRMEALFAQPERRSLGNYADDSSDDSDTMVNGSVAASVSSLRLRNLPRPELPVHWLLSVIMVLLLIADIGVVFWIMVEYYCVQIRDPTAQDSGCSRTSLCIFYGKLFAVWNVSSIVNQAVAFICGLAFLAYIHDEILLVAVGGVLIKYFEKEVALRCIAQYTSERPFRGWRGLHTTRDWYDAAYTPLVHYES
ncbi:hypothetical protein GQ600_27116 [Phytophthora cactorum]|nr:hypothetical protein GQ600_27116 [Phytophthora cactorum]